MIKKIIMAAVFITASTQISNAQHEDKYDVRNIYFHMGVIAGFAETVNLGVKLVGLSEMFTEAEADKYESVVKQIADRNNVLYYRENNFLVTDMFPASKTDGLTLFIIYKGDTLEKYKAIKKRKQELVSNGKYDDEGRKEIAYKFGHLLSYPDDVIDRLLRENGRND